MILSATQSGRGGDLYLKQLYLVGLGVVAMFVCLLFDYRRLADRAFLFYLVAVVVLVYVLFFGPRIAGTRRWLSLLGVRIQPSEFVKLVAALFVAKVFGDSRQESLGLRDIAGPGVAVGAPGPPHRRRARPRHRVLPDPPLPEPSPSWPGCG